MPSRYPRRSHQQWQHYLDKFRSQSALTQHQFCDAEGLSLGTFRKHLYRSPSAIAGAKQNSPQPTPVGSGIGAGQFSPVTIRDTERLPTGSCLELPGNIRLHTQSLPCAEYLHNLVKVFGHGH